MFFFLKRFFLKEIQFRKPFAFHETFSFLISHLSFDCISETISETVCVS